MDWFNQVDAQYKSELKDLGDGYFSRLEARLQTELGALRAELNATRSELLKWMFIYWTGSVLATAAFVLIGIRLSR